jgi:hypothetical protein
VRACPSKWPQLLTSSAVRAPPCSTTSTVNLVLLVVDKNTRMERRMVHIALSWLAHLRVSVVYVRASVRVRGRCEHCVCGGHRAAPPSDRCSAAPRVTFTMYGPDSLRAQVFYTRRHARRTHARTHARTHTHTHTHTKTSSVDRHCGV